MSTPLFDLIEELRALGGAPKVTYPTGNVSYPQTERVMKVPRGAETLALGSAEPDTVRFPNNILTDQISLRMDAQYVEVYRKYEVLPGPFSLQGQQYDPEYGFLAEYTEGEVKNGAAIGTAVSDVEPINYIKSNLKTYTVPTAALNSFYLTFPGTENIEFPKVLMRIDLTWDLATGSGTYSESGNGFAEGVSGSVSLVAQGRGQGSASVLGDIAPIFAPQPQPNLPVLDYFFFLPNPVTLSAILARASAIATALAGSATTVNAWPVFQPQVHTFIIVGQKVSVSCEAVARCSMSFNTGGTSGDASFSEAWSSGSGTNEDFGSTVRAITLPECIHGALTVSGLTSVAQASSAQATAYLSPEGSYWHGAGSDSPITLSTAAVGAIFPASLPATPTPALPASGLYLYKPDVTTYKWGYSTVRARIFDFAVIAPVQITLVDFTNAGPFATGGAGLAFIIPSVSGAIYGVWFQTGTESQPDLSAYGVTAYAGVSVATAATAAEVAAAVVTTFNGSIVWTVIVSPSDGNAAQFTALQAGLTVAASDVNSQAAISVQWGAA